MPDYKTEARTYHSWVAMRMRCENPNDDHYERYGGRGITVCERWRGRDGFQNFVSDMGSRPSGTTLDRKDGNGNYEPENCRWATPTQQARNRRSNHRIEFQGRVVTVEELSELTGIASRTLLNRIVGKGMSVDEALSKPIRNVGPRTRSRLNIRQA